MNQIPTADRPGLQPQALDPGEGEALWWAGQLAVIKATAADTGGCYSLVEITVGPGYGTPLHVHHREDEGFWMLDGHATFSVGDRSIEAGPGAYLFGPRDIQHQWIAGPQGARMLYLFAPGGFEDAIRAMAGPAEAPAPPPPDAPIPENLAEIAAEFGIDLLGPPPSA